MEILAPVGGKEQLLAAVRSGANAVYLGSKGFNARRNADNFDEDGLPEAVRYCHARGVAVHVTLNTLITDNETEKLIDEIRLIAQSGADAVIIQDMGVAALVRQCCPTLAMHASTQLSVHSVAGALFMRRMGFSRLVLARELSASEIKEIKDKSGLEVEVFVHGALCMSMSGNCYLSSLLGERSGNRGLCAQPCRLEFTAKGREYALSLKDLSLIERMDELVAAGVDSIKIEGRMKRPEYVAAAVTACKQALSAQHPDMEKLQAVFSRSGFTDGYFAGNLGPHMFGYRRKEDVTAAATVLGELASSYRGENPLIPIDMSFIMEGDYPVTLTVTDGVHRITIQGEVAQQAINRPTDLALVRRGLEKLGGTPFYLRELTAEIADGLMLPVSAINALRKEAAESLLEQRGQVQPCRFTAPPPRPTLRECMVGSTPQLHLRLERVEQLTALVKNTADRVSLPLWELYGHKELIAQLGDRLIAELPMLIFPKNEAKVSAQLAELSAMGLATVVAGSQGALTLAREAGLAVIGDYSLNILNSVALGEYERQGLSAATVSYECSMKAAKKLDGRIPRGVIGYGYLPVMSFRNCPVRSEKGCGGCKGTETVTDRKGNDFPLLCRQREYTQMLNPIPLYIGDKQEVLRGLSFVTLYFTTETPKQCDELLRLWTGGQPYPGQRTGGLYFRELL